MATEPSFCIRLGNGSVAAIGLPSIPYLPEGRVNRVIVCEDLVG